MKAAIFASGTGSNFEAIADSVALKEKGLEIQILVCDQPEAPVLERARKREIPTFVIQPKDYPKRELYEAVIIEKLRPLEIEYIFLAGYMRVVTTELIGAYPDHIINIHPSLLPKFSGLHGLRDSFNANISETGATVHYIDENVDTGPIIAQRSVPVYPEDTLATMEARIHEAEHILYPSVILNLLTAKNKEEFAK